MFTLDSDEILERESEIERERVRGLDLMSCPSHNLGFRVSERVR
jgi:hypothetical protein